MVQIITIPTDREPVMLLETGRIGPWAQSHGWVYEGYGNESDHVINIGIGGAGKSLDVLDFDCHGSPTSFDHTYQASLPGFARGLSQLPGFSSNTVIYLDACNTGLTSEFGGPIAQEMANAAGCTVYGSKGYLRGTFAEGNEICYASLGSGVGAYPGSRDASARNVWIAFSPVRPPAAPGMAPTGRRRSLMAMASTINFGDGSSELVTNEIIDVINSAFANDPVDFPSLRMAPDITLNYVHGNDVQVLDVYANGALIRDRRTGLAWRIPSGRLLQFQTALRTRLGLE